MSLLDFLLMYLLDIIHNLYGNVNVSAPGILLKYVYEGVANEFVIVFVQLYIDCIDKMVGRLQAARRLLAVRKDRCWY